MAGRRNRSWREREVERLALVPDVISGGHDIGARRQRLAKDVLGNAEAACGILAIDDDEIELEIGDEAGKLFPHRGSAGAANHVAEKEKSHADLGHALEVIAPLSICRRRTVAGRSP